MAQLFTVHFPKYCFEVQEEFSIEFPHADQLPFEPGVSDKGVPHVKEIEYKEEYHNPHQIKQWQSEGLKVGLRILEINKDKLAKEISGPSASTLLIFNDKPLTLREVQDKIHQNGHSSILFTFREDIPTFDDSEPLGLQWKGTYINNDYKEEETKEPVNLYDDTVSNRKQQQQKPSVNDENKIEYKIPDDAISVSSYHDDYPPFYVRLNNPNGYWRPTIKNEKSRDVWICFDLYGKKLVDKIHIQGSQDHTAYVQEFWIEFSDDLCHWNSHPMRSIKCRYVQRNDDKVLNDDKALNDKLDIPEPDKLKFEPTVEKNYGIHGTSSYEMATIKLWPVINARFIRIRPWKWRNACALRIELYGNERPLEHQEVGKVVTSDSVPRQFKQQFLTALVGKSPDSKAIQIDCQAIITKAMDKAGCTSYGIIDIDVLNSLLVCTTPNSATSERVMDELSSVGVGRQMGVISATPIEWRNAAENIEQHISNKDGATSTGFYASVKSHKTIQVVVERIMNSAALTFDYFCMLTIASMIAVGGLATNSAVIVVASMLVSPIMGPVLAFTFGVTLRNWPLAKLGVYNELFSLFICLLVGFVVGFFYALGTKNRNDWPTVEMASRGNPWSLADGAYIAAASGVGVALSVLGDYLSTVVGVAISASLLPPAVNAGMLLSFCIYEEIYPQYVNHEYSEHDYDVNDTLRMAAISFILTIENIIIIFLSATIMFRIKDIVKTRDRNQSSLWDHISQFRQQHRKLHRGFGGIDVINKAHKTAVEFDGDIEDDDNIGISTEDINVSRTNRYRALKYDEWATFTKEGTKANEALDQFKYTIKQSEADILQSTLKGELFKRQVSTFYNEHEQYRDNTTDSDVFGSIGDDEKSNKKKKKKGYTSTALHDDDDSSSNSDDDAMNKEKNNKSKPSLNTIFSQPDKQNKAENKPLMQEDNDDNVTNVVVDENDS